jgi:hypothetical protein
MKLTWGHKLIFVFIIFGSMMTYMVYRSFGTRVDMVSNQYYEDELEYQQLIDGAQEVNNKRSALNLSLDGRLVMVRSTDTSTGNSIKGTAWFYCISDSRKDKKIQLGVQENNSALGEVLLQEGNYIAKLRWATENGNFYSEEKFKVK